APSAPSRGPRCPRRGAIAPRSAARAADRLAAPAPAGTRQPGSAELPARERLHEGRVVDERPARRIDQKRARLHAAELSAPYETARRGAEREVERHGVRAPKELVEPRARLDAAPPQVFRRRRRRVAAHAHAEPSAGNPGGGAPGPAAAAALHGPERVAGV